MQADVGADTCRYSQIALQHDLCCRQHVVVLPVLGKLQHQQQVVLQLRTHQLPCCMLLLVVLLAAAAAVTSTAAANAASLRWQLSACLQQQLHAVAVQRCQQQLLALHPGSLLTISPLAALQPVNNCDSTSGAVQAQQQADD